GRDGSITQGSLIGGLYALTPSPIITTTLSSSVSLLNSNITTLCIERYKPILVGKGFHQKEGIDFKETFSLVAMMILNVKRTATPMDPIVKLNETDGYLLPDPSTYRTLVGKLLYLTITRPYLSFASQDLSQYSHSLRSSHFEALIRVLRYVKLCPGLRCLLLNLGVTIPTPNLVLCDNASTIDLANNPIQNAMAKHIEIDFHLSETRSDMVKFFLVLSLLNLRLQIFSPKVYASFSMLIVYQVGHL
ncbi:cysteine-rich receptor-like protein kinase 8, partial [Tanacetum coccineum]